MIISIETRDPMDCGPINLHNIWDIMDLGRMSQRVFVNTTISGYWKIDSAGFMKKTFLLENVTPSIIFVLDMRKMNAGELHNMYQKLRRKNVQRRIEGKLSGEKISLLITSDRKNSTLQKDAHLNLVKIQ